MRVALVVDDLIQRGGQEFLFKNLCDEYKDADIYTSLISSAWEDTFQNRNVYTSFLQKIPLASRFGKIFVLFGLFNIAFLNFNFSKYDLVISISSRFSHLLNIKYPTKHIVYINSPSRYLWAPYTYFSNNMMPKLLSPIFSLLRIMDVFFMRKPDCIVSNSEHIQKKVAKIYRRYSEVIHPFAGDIPNGISSENNLGDYYLVITRIVPWKKIDIAIEAFRLISSKLYIVGEGDRGYVDQLLHIAPNNVSFLGRVGESEKYKLLKHAKALIMTQEEDFGISAIESMSVGTPVIAFGSGGAKHTVVKGITGVHFDEQNPQSLLNALSELNSLVIDREILVKVASKYSRRGFFEKLNILISNTL